MISHIIIYHECLTKFARLMSKPVPIIRRDTFPIIRGDISARNTVCNCKHRGSIAKCMAATARGNRIAGAIMLHLTLYGPRPSTMQVKMASRPTETVRLFNGWPNLGKSVTRERSRLKYHAIARALYV